MRGNWCEYAPVDWFLAPLWPSVFFTLVCNGPPDPRLSYSVVVSNTRLVGAPAVSIFTPLRLFSDSLFLVENRRWKASYYLSNSLKSAFASSWLMTLTPFTSSLSNSLLHHHTNSPPPPATVAAFKLTLSSAIFQTFFLDPDHSSLCPCPPSPPPLPLSPCHPLMVHCLKVPTRSGDPFLLLSLAEHTHVTRGCWIRIIPPLPVCTLILILLLLLLLLFRRRSNGNGW